MNKAKRISIILLVVLMLGLVYYFAVEFQYFSSQKITLSKSETAINLNEVTTLPQRDYCNAEIRNSKDGKVLALLARDSSLTISILEKEVTAFNLDGSFSQGSFFNKVMTYNFKITPDSVSEDGYLLELTADKSATTKCGEYVCTKGEGVSSIWRVEKYSNNKVLASNEYRVGIEQRCDEFGNKKHGYDIFTTPKGQGLIILLELIAELFGGSLH